MKKDNNNDEREWERERERRTDPFNGMIRADEKNETTDRVDRFSTVAAAAGISGLISQRQRGEAPFSFPSSPPQRVSSPGPLSPGPPLPVFHRWTSDRDPPSFMFRRVLSIRPLSFHSCVDSSSSSISSSSSWWYLVEDFFIMSDRKRNASCFNFVWFLRDRVKTKYLRIYVSEGMLRILRIYLTSLLTKGNNKIVNNKAVEIEEITFGRKDSLLGGWIKEKIPFRIGNKKN